MLRTREQVRVLGPGDRDAFIALAEQDPVVNVFADYRARLTTLDERWLGGLVWGRFEGDELVAGCHLGANLVHRLLRDERRVRRPTERGRPRVRTGRPSS